MSDDTKRQRRPRTCKNCGSLGHGKNNCPSNPQMKMAAKPKNSGLEREIAKVDAEIANLLALIDFNRAVKTRLEAALGD